jgi:hypothetical protein
MSYLQVNLSSASAKVREVLKEFPWIETETGSDVIIIAATEAALADKLRRLQQESAATDTTLEFPTEMKIVPRDAIINGRSIRHLFYEKLSETNDPRRYSHLNNGDNYDGGIWYIKD